MTHANAGRGPVVVLAALALAVALAGCGTAARAGRPAAVATGGGTDTTATAAAGGVGSTAAGSTPAVPPARGHPTATTSLRSTVVTTAPLKPVLAGSGVTGTVLAGPTCPVERAGQPCPPHPVVTEVDALAPGGTVVGRTTSDAGGRFAIPLPPGAYTISAATGPTLYPRCRSVTVTVPPGGQVTAAIGCDTGIR